MINGLIPGYFEYYARNSGCELERDFIFREDSQAINIENWRFKHSGSPIKRFPVLSHIS